MPSFPALRSRLRPILATSLGAVLGALSRYGIGEGVTHWLQPTVPIATFLINMTGCLGMGLFAALTTAIPPTVRGKSFILHPDLRLLIATGFLGAYTTFSSYELETAQLWTDQPGAALIYWFISPLVGLASFYVGQWAVEQVRDKE